MKKRTKKWHCLFQYGALYLLLQFFLLAYLQVACQSENALQREPSVRMAITEQNAEALQGSLLQNIDTIPTQYKKQRCPFRFLHRRMAVCCICSGNFCNQGKFEKTKEMHRLFQYGAHCLSGRERLAARAGRSGGDYRAERRSLARFTLAEH